jgi:hypothetical protein
MRFDAYSVWCSQRCQAEGTKYSRLSMSPSIYLYGSIGTGGDRVDYPLEKHIYIWRPPHYLLGDLNFIIVVNPFWRNILFIYLYV